MRVTRLAVRDFRNYERADVALGSGLTLVVGPNGAGKTNLLEALYVGCTGRSFRTATDRDLVRFGSRVTRVRIATEGEDGAHAVEVGVEPGVDKRLRVDGARVERLSDTRARPLVSVFSPDRLELVKGPPGVRRAHLDQLTGALWPAAAGTRAEYGRALAQRNALLARLRGSGRDGLLDPWDAELARLGVELMGRRRTAVDLLAGPLAELAADLGLPRPVSATYRTSSRAATADNLRQELREHRGTDLARGFTGRGPHRDDLILAHGGVQLRAFGSQGQQRAVLLALLFAERAVLISELTRPPLMLLDDVMSELDSERRHRLTALVEGAGQTVITATDAELVPGGTRPGVTLIEVADGAARPADLPRAA